MGEELIVFSSKGDGGGALKVQNSSVETRHSSNDISGSKIETNTYLNGCKNPLVTGASTSEKNISTDAIHLSNND